jgi:hypothetical protein
MFFRCNNFGPLLLFSLGSFKISFGRHSFFNAWSWWFINDVISFVKIDINA